MQIPLILLFSAQQFVPIKQNTGHRAAVPFIAVPTAGDNNCIGMEVVLTLRACLPMEKHNFVIVAASGNTKGLKVVPGGYERLARS